MRLRQQIKASAMISFVCLVGILVGITGLAAADPTTLVIGLSADPKTLTPASGGTDNDSCVAFRMFSSLTQSDENFQAAPDLAQSWEVSEDCMTYTFHLNPDAKFHDGTPVTAEDVEFSVLEMGMTCVNVCPRGLGGDTIESVEIPDEHTIVFRLGNPFPEVLNPYYGFGPRCSSVVKKAHYEGTDYFTNPYNYEPIGSGPYKFVEWVRGSHIVLERWDEYWGEKPTIETVVFRIIPDPMAMALAFENGEVDWVPVTLLASEIKRLNSVAGRDARFHGVPCGDSISLRFNHRREVFQNIAVRRAFTYAINRGRIPGFVYHGGAIAAPGNIMLTPVSEWYFNPNVKQVEYDPEMAKTLLDKAGYPVGSDGWRFHINLIHGTFFPEDIQVAELIKADLAKVKVDVEINTLDYAAWVDRGFVNWDFDLNLSSLCSGPTPIAMKRFHTDNIKRVAWANDAGFSNFEYDALFERMISETDVAKRRAYLYRMQEILVEEQPHVHVVHKQMASGWNPTRFTAEPEAFWSKGLGYFLMHLNPVRPAE